MKNKTFSNSIVRTVMLVNTAPIRVFVDDELMANFSKFPSKYTVCNIRRLLSSVARFTSKYALMPMEYNIEYRDDGHATYCMQH